MKKHLLGLLCVVFLLCSCSRQAEEETVVPQHAREDLLKGVSVSPRSFLGNDFTEFLERVKQSQEVLMWAGDWIELSEGGAPVTFSDLSDQYDYVPVIEVGHYTQESGELNRPLTAETRELYLESTLDFIEKYHPLYFGIGVEVNVFCGEEPASL